MIPWLNRTTASADALLAALPHDTELELRDVIEHTRAAGAFNNLESLNAGITEAIAAGRLLHCISTERSGRSHCVTYLKPSPPSIVWEQSLGRAFRPAAAAQQWFGGQG